MSKKIVILILIFIFIFVFLFSQEPENISQLKSKKRLFLYFMGEEAGYEEYEWIEYEDKYVLSVKGELNRPVSLITELMTIEVDREFKPLKFYFKGKVRGVTQEIESTVIAGEVKNRITAGQQARDMTGKISPDALILPNGIFSPYVILAKKLKSLIREKITLPAYIIPQLEIKASVEPDAENAHLFHLALAGTKIELLTDEEGDVRSISVPSQSMEARVERLDKEEEPKREGETGHELIVQGSKVGKGFYRIEQEDKDILIKGETQQVIQRTSLNFQFEQRLSPDWNLKEAFLKGKVNDKEVELRAKVEGDSIKVFLQQGNKTSKKEMRFTPDVIFQTENPLLDSFLFTKKLFNQEKKKIFALAKSWGSFYFDEPLFFPVTIQKEGEEILNWQDEDIRTQKHFINYAGSNGGYIWAEKDRVLKISYPFAAMDVYHQDYINLETKEITSPEITSDKYVSEEVTFPSGDIKLAGTLTIPKNNRSKHPVAVLISGSGPQDRNEDTVGPGGLKFGIFKQIAHQLSEDGIAVLRYDDRGVGKSEGNFIEAAQEDLIQDVQAVVKYLRTRNDIRSDQIVLIGHSEGAIIAPRVAAEDSKIKAVVLLAGTAKTGDEVLREQFGFILDCMELSGEERRRARALYENILKVIRGEPVEREIEEELKPQIEPQLKWLRSFVNYDPLSVLDGISSYVLIINGGKDKQVLPHHAKMLYKKLKKLKKKVDIKIYPDLNHLFIPSETGAYAEYARQSMEGKRVSQKLLDFLLGWLNGVLGI